MDLSDHDNANDLVSAYPLIGEYIVSFNDLVESIEFFILELTNPYKRGYGSRVTGANFASAQKGKYPIDSVINIFYEDAHKIIVQTPYIHTIKSFKVAERELKFLVKEMKWINDIRNHYVHGFWRDWTDKHGYLPKSTPTNRIENKKIKTSKWARKYLRVTLKDLRDDIKHIDKIAMEIFIFTQKYQYGTITDGYEIISHIPREKLSPARERQVKATLRNYTWLPWSKRGYKNIGPATLIWLESIEIYSNEDLKNEGAENVYTRLIRHGHIESRRLKAALIGSVSNQRWQDVIKKIK